MTVDVVHLPDEEAVAHFRARLSGRADPEPGDG